MTTRSPSRHVHRAIMSLSVVATFLAMAAPAIAQPLPGGANSLSEAYQDWQINCTSSGDITHCTMAQVQVDPKTKQRVLGMEIGMTADGATSAMLILPFGLALAAGVSLQIDDGETTGTLGFSTCLPVGCLVPIALDDEKAATLMVAKTLTIAAAANDSAEPISFSISLAGFSAAYARLNQLTQ